MERKLFTFALLFILQFSSMTYSQGVVNGVTQDSIAKKDAAKNSRCSGGSFGLSACAGISKVLDSDFPRKDVTDTLTTRPFMPSAQIGFFYRIDFGKRFFVAAEPGFSMVQGNGRTVITAPGKRKINELRKRLYFFSVPVSFGISVHKFSFSIGVQPSLLVYGQTQENFASISPTGSVPRGKSEYKKISSNPFDIGATAEISARFYKRLSLFIHFYYGLMDIYRPAENELDAPSWQIRQLTLGVRCPMNKGCNIGY